MKYHSLIIWSIYALLVSCSIQEAEVTAPKDTEEPEFYASIEGSSTRAFVDENLCVLWNADDRISIFNKSTYNQEYRFTGSDGDNSGSFKKLPNDDFVTGNPLDYSYSVYPYHESTKISNNGILTVELPKTQAYRENSFGMGANTMVAVTQTNELMFKNLCGYLAIRLFGGDVALSSISIRGNNNERIAGKALVTADMDSAPTLVFDEANSSGETTLVFSEPIKIGTSAETATVFWLVVPPTNFTQGFTLTVRDNKEGEFIKTTTSSFEIRRNTLSKMSPLRVEPMPQKYLQPLTLEAIDDGIVSLSNPLGLTIEYNIDSTKWISTTSSIEIELMKGKRLFLRGDNESYSRIGFRGRIEHTNIDCDSPCYLYGNIMSLIDSKDFSKLKTINKERAFYALFSMNENIINHPDKELLLPANELSPECYMGLFSGCSNLSLAPKLPARALAKSCYYKMFELCEGLTQIPELPATTLEENCYAGMFAGCTNLTQVSILPATTLAKSCYSEMFAECTNLIQAPKLPAIELADSCYSDMFNRCISLSQAPELPATILAKYCYNKMFWRCISLSHAPVLPATSLSESCYYEMFGCCNSLTEAPRLPADTLADHCYGLMFFSCPNLAKAPDLPATSLAEGCYFQMFDFCTGLAQATELPATVLVKDCYSGMFSCSGLTKAPSLPATTLAQSCYSGMFGGCYELTQAPELPATTLVDSCYIQMFEGCSRLQHAPDLPATTMVESCYEGMFSGCRALIQAPELPATTLAESCYSSMFYNCQSLKDAPELPSLTVPTDSYARMFYGCSNLEYVKMMAKDISNKDNVSEWLDGVAEKGVFVKNAAATWNEEGIIPSGWTVKTEAD